MNEMRFTLLTDGPSDVVLVPILRWLLIQHLPDYAIQSYWADVRPFRCRTLAEKVTRAISLSPCDLLFVHRDAEAASDPLGKRTGEIEQAVREAKLAAPPPIVCVIPIRMQEAWLLFDESAIRRAAGNPNGKMPLKLPPLRRVEDDPDPKDTLHSLLRQASGRSGRDLKKMNLTAAAGLIADRTPVDPRNGEPGFAPLRQLSAFTDLEKRLRQTLAAHFTRQTP